NTPTNNPTQRRSWVWSITSNLIQPTQLAKRNTACTLFRSVQVTSVVFTKIRNTNISFLLQRLFTPQSNVRFPTSVVFHRSPSMKIVCKLIFLSIVCAVTALAQSNTGRLVGTVSDASGVLPGASVVVTDKNTGRERTVVTSGDGSFAVPQLDAGAYTVKI